MNASNATSFDRVDHVPGGMMLPLMGPSDTELRQIPALLAMNQSAPLIRIHAKGSNYTYHTGAQGHFLQLASNSAVAGEHDDIQLQYEAQALTGMSFSPGVDASNVVPQVGLSIAEGESALFR